MRPSLIKSMAGGLAGTIMLTMMMRFVAPFMLGHPMDVAGMLGNMMGGSWAMGMVMHFVNGTVIFPLIYAFLLYRLLPGRPAVKGLVWGVVLWLGLQLIAMPMMEGGLFSMNAGGMKAAIVALVGHLVYGSLLGSIAGAGVGLERQEDQVRRAA